MALRYVEMADQLGDRDQLPPFQTCIKEDAQRIVGMQRQTHAKIPRALLSITCILLICFTAATQAACSPKSTSMTAIPRYRTQTGPAVLSAGFRPFFLAASVWAAVGIPLWLEIYSGRATLPTLLQPTVWHAHEMVFGFAAATVA